MLEVNFPLSLIVDNYTSGVVNELFLLLYIYIKDYIFLRTDVYGDWMLVCFTTLNNDVYN